MVAVDMLWVECERLLLCSSNCEAATGATGATGAAAAAAAMDSFTMTQNTLSIDPSFDFTRDFIGAESSNSYWNAGEIAKHLNNNSQSLVALLFQYKEQLKAAEIIKLLTSFLLINKKTYNEYKPQIVELIQYFEQNHAQICSPAQHNSNDPPIANDTESQANWISLLCNFLSNYSEMQGVNLQVDFSAFLSNKFKIASSLNSNQNAELFYGFYPAESIFLHKYLVPTALNFPLKNPHFTVRNPIKFDDHLVEREDTIKHMEITDSTPNHSNLNPHSQSP
jgi:hypothetical protein